ncbi:MAG: 3'(2'),5'-bisphosphate nucleotidase CysQ [Trueperaceae bacterium]|nr:3'(2'),5'-bisphosphate nucleotidase CysQ [Trueperaceae bacterium]
MITKIIDIAAEAGKRILEVYESADFNVDFKADDSPLTRADLASHHFILGALENLSPDIPVLSEESKGIAYSERKNWSKFWLVDPLDGTKEFIKRNGEFTVNIALIEEGKPIMGVVHVPVTGLTYWAQQGQGAFKREAGQDTKLTAATTVSKELKVVASRSHAGAETTAFLEALAQDYKLDVVSKGSSLKLCQVAENSADLYPRLGPTMEWDTAAAQCIVEQAGGEVTTLEATPLRYNKENLLNPYFMVSSPATKPFWKNYLNVAV